MGKLEDTNARRVALEAEKRAKLAERARQMDLEAARARRAREQMVEAREAEAQEYVSAYLPTYLPPRMPCVHVNGPSQA